VLTGAVAATLAPAGTVLALDLGNEPNLSTETIASRDRLKAYDRIKVFGAERISDRDHFFGQPIGIREGGFFFYPSLDTSAAFDDNLYGMHLNPVSDFRFEASPVLRVQSDFPRHALRLIAGARNVSYLENTDQDYTNLFGLASGALHIDNANTLSIAAGSALEHEERREITAPLAAAEPGAFMRHTVSAGLTHDVGRLYGTLSGTATWLDYDKVRANDGSLLDQDVRDQRILSTQLRTGYRISPGYEVLSKLKLIRRENEGTGADDKSSTGYEATVGVAMETDPLLRWFLVGGYGVRDFDNASAGSVSSYLLEGSFEWLVTQKLTLYGTAAHLIDDTLGAADLGHIASSVKLEAEYEIYHNLVGRAGLGLTRAELVGADRTDDIFEASLGLDYYLSPQWLLALDYHYQDRQSTDDDFTATRNQIKLSAKYRY
jgi:hypothetical protein